LAEVSSFQDIKGSVVNENLMKETEGRAQFRRVERRIKRGGWVKTGIRLAREKS